MHDVVSCVYDVVDWLDPYFGERSLQPKGLLETETFSMATTINLETSLLSTFTGTVVCLTQKTLEL